MRPLSLLGVLWLTACITVNVYFPAAAAERAADRLICEVYGVDCNGTPVSDDAPAAEPPSAPDPERMSPSEDAPQSSFEAPPTEPAPVTARSEVIPGARHTAMVRPIGARVGEMFAQLTNHALDVVIPSAQAQQPDINISSPAIRGLESAMEARHQQLKPHYASGAVGLKYNGLVGLRDASAVDLRARNQVKQLVADENRDRNALYAEIAAVNGHPEWQESIREIFARRWIANAPSGWFYEDRPGVWRRK